MGCSGSKAEPTSSAAPAPGGPLAAHIASPENVHSEQASLPRFIQDLDSPSLAVKGTVFFEAAAPAPVAILSEEAAAEAERAGTAKEITHHALLDSTVAVRMGDEYIGERKAAGHPDVYVGEWKFATRKYGNGDVYEGEWMGDKREGRGTCTQADGHVYEGEWKADKTEGRGTLTGPSGIVYEGEFEADEMQGCGTLTLDNGETWSMRFVANAPVEGVRWSADWQSAWRQCDGKAVESISLEEAAQIAEALGLPVPLQAWAAYEAWDAWVEEMRIRTPALVTALAPLDRELIATLAQGDIALIRTESLLELTKLPYRQQLEAADPNAFMPPAESAALLRSGRREVGALTYGWCSGGDPDPDGAYLRSVQAALRTPACAHIKALFWDYASLFQHPPGGKRTDEQGAAFVRASHHTTGLEPAHTLASLRYVCAEGRRPRSTLAPGRSAVSMSWPTCMPACSGRVCSDTRRSHRGHNASTGACASMVWRTPVFFTW